MLPSMVQNPEEFKAVVGFFELLIKIDRTGIGQGRKRDK